LNKSSNKHVFFNKLIKPFMAVGTTAVLSQILVVFQNLITARWIGPELNVYVLAGFNAAALGFVLVNWGFDHWLLQRCSIDNENKHKSLGVVISSKFILGTLLCLGVLIALPYLRPKIYLPFILALCLLDTLIDSLSNSAYTFFYATHRFKQSSLILTISRVARLVGTIVLILLKVKDLPILLGLRLLIDLATLAYLWWMLVPRFKRIKLVDFKAISQQTWTFGVAEILNFVYDRADLTLLAFLTVFKSEISYYGTALNIAFAGIAILQTLQNVLVPYIIKQEKSGQYKAKKALYIPPLLLLLGAGIAGSLIFFFFGQELIDLLMGQAYSAAGPLLTLTSPLVSIKAINVALSSFLIARQREKLKLLPLAIVTILKTALILVFYKSYRLEGMIVIFTLCELILLIFYAIQLLRTRGQKAQKTLQTEEAPSP
jgi:O-antigen/teichoic acid export membrane protein